MEETLLKRIQPIVVKYADVISNVLKVDVEIVDKNLYRIAGTGVYKDKINENISSEGYVYNHAMKTGKHQIIENPGSNAICRECKQRGRCVEKLQISTPLIYKKEIVGVIGLVCTREEQKRYVMKELQSHIQFLYQIGELIATKINNQQETERNVKTLKLLNQIIDSMNNGVLVLDRNSQIAHMNNNAMKQLKLNPSYLNKSIQITTSNEYIAQGETFNVTIEDKVFYLIGQLIPVFPVIQDYDKIFIFNQIQKSKSEVYYLTSEVKLIRANSITGQSSVMLQLKDKIKKVATSNSTVLITGESGTGKELIARALHSESDRCDEPFIAINCGAIPDALLESELFGYVRGAFSGANPNGRIGKFELANKGVLFLDEIGDMPLYLQVKLLRVLQERKLVRVGSNQLIDLDIRVVAATNKDLIQMIKENKFREDLYYRLNVIPLEAPALKDRKGDIGIIIKNLIDKYNGIFNKYVHTVNDEAMELLLDYPWPGNIRELENTIEFMINLADETGILTIEMLPKSIIDFKRKSEEKPFDTDIIRSLKDIEKEYIKKALDKYGYDTKGKQIAAKKLGIGIATLYRKVDEML